MAATVIILPVIRVERDAVDLTRQLVPAEIPENVVELWRVRIDRDLAAVAAALGEGQHDGARGG